MASRVTQAVRMMSTLHSNFSSIRQEGVLRRTVFNPEHFPKFLVVINIFACYAGYSFMDSIHRHEELRVLESVRSEDLLQRRLHATRRFTIVASSSNENAQNQSFLSER